MLRVAIATLSGRVLAEYTSSAESDMAQPTVVDLALGSLQTAARSAGYGTAPLAAVVLSVPAPVPRGVGAPVAGPGTGQRWGRGPRGSTRAWPTSWRGGRGARPWSKMMPTLAPWASTSSARAAKAAPDLRQTRPPQRRYRPYPRAAGCTAALPDSPASWPMSRSEMTGRCARAGAAAASSERSAPK